MQCVALDSSTAAVDYCRRARRIRASFGKNPSLRQHALRQLATQRNAQTRPVEPIFQHSSAFVIERGFTEHAAEKLQPFGFTFSDRVNLLNSAERLGISRFRANIILAIHEHRAGKLPQPASKTEVFVPSFLAILSAEILIVGLIAWACMC